VTTAAKRDERGTKVATPGLDGSLLVVRGSAAQRETVGDSLAN